MAKSDKQAIGKGIRALLSNIEKEESKDIKQAYGATHSGSIEIEISKIETNPFQPRTDFDKEALEELATSIKTFGIIQPVTVRRLNSKKFQIISGERRLRAARKVGLKRIPAFIREADDQGMLEMALLENIQRTDLNPLEIALSYRRLIDECNLTHEALSERLGKKRSSVSNYLRILKLPPSAQKALQKDIISMGHAKVMAGIAAVEEQVSLLDAILRDGLSVRAAEKWIMGAKKSLKNQKKPESVHPEVSRMQEILSDHLGKKIQIKRSATGSGSIKIPFRSDDELNQIVESMLE